MTGRDRGQSAFGGLALPSDPSSQAPPTPDFSHRSRRMASLGVSYSSPCANVQGPSCLLVYLRALCASVLCPASRQSRSTVWPRYRRLVDSLIRFWNSSWACRCGGAWLFLGFSVFHVRSNPEAHHPAPPFAHAAPLRDPLPGFHRPMRRCSRRERRAGFGCVLV